MKIDFSRKILDLKGGEILENGTAATLGVISCTVLTSSLPDEQNLPADKKVKRFQFATLAAQGNMQEITPEQFTELKELIGKAFGPLVVGRAYEILDEASK